MLLDDVKQFIKLKSFTVAQSKEDLDLEKEIEYERYLSLEDGDKNDDKPQSAAVAIETGSPQISRASNYLADVRYLMRVFVSDWHVRAQPTSRPANHQHSHPSPSLNEPRPPLQSSY